MFVCMSYVYVSYREYTTQVLIVIDDQDTVTSLGSHHLGGFNDHDTLSHRERLGWPQGGYSAGCLSCAMTHTSGARPFLEQFVLDLFANSLYK